MRRWHKPKRGKSPFIGGKAAASRITRACASCLAGRNGQPHPSQSRFERASYEFSHRQAQGLKQTGVGASRATDEENRAKGGAREGRDECSLLKTAILPADNEQRAYAAYAANATP